MAVAKFWFEQHGAIPAAMSHGELEFELPTPISKERAMEAGWNRMVRDLEHQRNFEAD